VSGQPILPDPEPIKVDFYDGELAMLALILQARHDGYLFTTLEAMSRDDLIAACSMMATTLGQLCPACDDCIQERLYELALEADR
jgi:hypothetical protein